MNLPRHKCGLYLTHNANRSYYKSIEEAIAEVDDGPDEWVSPEEREKALVADSIWNLQWYPDTPIGFFSVSASTLEAVLREAQKIDEEG